MSRPRSFDEERVLDGAVELFRAHGFEGVSVPELSARLGICRQSLYNSFGDKRGLYLAALQRWGQREVDSKLALLAAEGSALDKLRTVVRGLAAMATQCPSSGCLTVVAIVESTDDAEALEVVEQHVQRLELGFRRALERAQAEGELRPEASATRLARSLLNSCYGLGVLSRLPSSGPRVGDAVAEMLATLERAALGPSPR